MITRSRHSRRLVSLLERFPVVAILGARQIGKTTLSRVLTAGGQEVHYFDLESPGDQARLQEPELALGRLQGLVVLDEIQLVPELFPVLRVLVDRPERRLRFLILGSASGDLLRQSSESLAGRIAYHELEPLALDEVGESHFEQLWIRGGFPSSFLAPSEHASAEWRRSFVRTFLERDLPSLGVRVPGETLRRFWTMMAHVHGNVWNSRRFATTFGVADTTVRRYLDLLTDALVIRQLPPWFENVSKRQVKAPKVYIADSGLLHTLLDLEDFATLEAHPQLGPSFEGFVIEQIKVGLGARRDQCFFWATHAGAELDLLVVSGTLRVGFEIKRTASPRITKSLRSAIDTLGLHRVFLIHGGEHCFPLAEGIEAVAASRLLGELPSLERLKDEV